MERRKGTIYLSSFKIFCNSKCERNATDTVGDDEHEVIKQLKEIITELHEESIGKTQTIEKRRRQSLAFEQDVIEAEENFRIATEKYQVRIATLEQTILENNKKSDELINQNCEEFKKIQNQYKLELSKKEKIGKEHKRKIDELKIDLDNAQKSVEKFQIENKNLMKKNKEQWELIDRIKGATQSKDKATQTEKEIKQQSLQLEMRLKKQDKSNFTENVDEDKLQSEIKILNEKLSDLSRKSSVEKNTYKEDIDKYREEIAEQKRLINRINLKNETLRKSIEKYKEEFHSQKNKLTKNYPSDNIQNQQKTIHRKTIRKPKILLIGGPRSYNHGKILKGITNSSYDINCKSLNDGLFESITDLHNKLITNFSEEDYSIIFTTSENIRKGRNITEKEMKQFIAQAKGAKLVIISTPLHQQKPALSKLTEQQNSSIEKCVKSSYRQDIFYIDCNKIVNYYDLDDNGELTNNGRYKILKHIHEHYLKKKSKATSTDLSNEGTNMNRADQPETGTTKQPTETNNQTTAKPFQKKTKSTIEVNRNEKQAYREKNESFLFVNQRSINQIEH